MGEPPPPAAMVAVLSDDVLLGFILKRLAPMELVRAALASHRWCAAAALAAPRAPPLLGYFCCRERAESSLSLASAELPAFFAPSDDSSPRLSLDLAPEDSLGSSIHDVFLGLVMLVSCKRPELLPRILVLDPASRRRVLLPPPPHEALPNDQWGIIGAAVLAREHPSKLDFKAVWVTLDDGRPRAWVAFVNDTDRVWRALPPSNVVHIDLEPHPNSFGKHCVHADGKLCWRIGKSGRLLALDPSSFDFSLLPAPNDLGRHLSRFGGGESERCSFPYLLCWPPAFLDKIEGNTWTKNTMNLVRIALHNISYIRRLFAEEFFCDTDIQPADVQVKQLIPMDDESQRFMDWVEKGIYDALQKKFLRSILFCICEESGPLIEEYSLTFSYDVGIVMDLRMRGCVDSIWTLTSNAADGNSKPIWKSALEMVQNMISLLSPLRKIPEERIIMVKLLYFDDVTPIDYEPPFFQCYDGTRKHATLKETSLDMAYGEKSVLVSDSCHAMEDLPCDIQQGYLYCISKKKVVFHFDSGSSFHICDNKKLFDNLHGIPDKDMFTVDDCQGEKLSLKMSGEVKYEQIRLNPVFYEPNLNFNIISLGELDDGKNLIYLGDERIKIFDTTKGEVIGEGYLHNTRNEYIARSITSIRQTSQSAVAGSTTNSMESSAVAVTTKEKSLWVIDSLCNNHMTGNRKILSDIRSCERRAFVTPRGKFECTEIGNVKTDAVTLFNVLYNKELRINIISEGQLDREGYSCTRFAHKCNVQWRATQALVGLAYQDENSCYYVEYFRHVTDPSLKPQEEDRGQKLKRPRQDGSSASSRKRSIHS